MHTRFFLVAILVCALLVEESDAWFSRRRRTGRRRCPARSGASPYYFGTTNLVCLWWNGKKGKRESAPSRSTGAFTHRFIYYKGKYFEFFSNSKVVISNSRYMGHKCSGRIESRPAGYSSISLACIEGCAKNYRCRFGGYGLFGNNCHKFANRISTELCTRSSYCPAWCRGPCNDVSYGRKR